LLEADGVNKAVFVQPQFVEPVRCLTGTGNSGEDAKFIFLE
jgi:hypothetical protein